MLKIYIKQFIFFTLVFFSMWLYIGDFKSSALIGDIPNTITSFLKMFVNAGLLAFIANSQIKFKKLIGFVLPPIFCFLFLYIGNFNELYSCVEGVDSSLCFDFNILFYLLSLWIGFSTILFSGFLIINKYSNK